MNSTNAFLRYSLKTIYASLLVLALLLRHLNDLNPLRALHYVMIFLSKEKLLG